MTLGTPWRKTPRTNRGNRYKIRLHAVVTALVLAAASTAEAQTVYYACVTIKDGGVRMVSAAATCAADKEVKISWNQVGPVGPQGPQGAPGPQGPQGPQGSSAPNPLKVATLRWFDVLDAPAIDLGGSTAGIARANDGTILGQFDANSNVSGVAYDGTYVWGANNVHGSVTRLRASDGACVPVAGGGTSGLAGPCSVSLGGEGLGIAFDGANIWAGNYSAGFVRKIRARDGQVMGDFAVGANPGGIAFDGPLTGRACGSPASMPRRSRGFA
jgi:hypothetical protein